MTLYLARCSTFPSGTTDTAIQNVTMAGDPTTAPSGNVITPTASGVSYCYKICSYDSVGSNVTCGGIQVSLAAAHACPCHGRAYLISPRVSWPS